MLTNPLIFIDVDGVLIPSYARKRPDGYMNFRARRSELGVKQKGSQRIWLNREHGGWLTALGAELVWATAWEGAANYQIGRRIGLPTLPNVQFTSNRTFQPNPDGSHWKLDDIMAYADGRPFVWLDDGISGADTVRVDLEYPEWSLLYRVDPRRGLTVDDMLNVWNWIKAFKE